MGYYVNALAEKLLANYKKPDGNLSIRFFIGFQLPTVRNTKNMFEPFRYSLRHSLP